MPQKLPIALAQVKVVNNSEGFLNEIRQIVYSLYSLYSLYQNKSLKSIQ